MIHAIVTGHSKGLGAALTQQLLREGNAVLGMSRSSMAAQSAAQSATTPHFREVALDLSQPSQMSSFLEGPVLAAFLSKANHAVLINNAGLLGPVGQTGQLAAREIFASITANVAAAIALTNAFVAATHHCPDRRVVHISSGAARSPYSGWSVYCASKAALDHHARSVHEEHHAGLRIESLAPGIIDTGMQAQVRATTLAQFPMRPKFEKLKAEGALASPTSVAERLLAHLTSKGFGTTVCSDLRSL